MTTAQILDGKALAESIHIELQSKIKQNTLKKIRPPCLAVVLVGNNPASSVYVKNKHQACSRVGITSIKHTLPESTSENDLLKLLDKLNQSTSVDGILVQLPLPKHINSVKILEHLNPNKDVDGFHPYNLGRLAQRNPTLRPCTPLGVMKLLEASCEPFKYRHAVIVGASNIVGRPMALELLTAGSTVTVCHRFTKDLAVFAQQADILISAVGKPNIIKGEWIKKGSTVIDIGITRLDNGSLSGDVEFEKSAERAAWITPVPGGVGPMTVAMLLENTYTTYIANKDK